MVIWNMVIFLRISKYGNIAYGNVFRNYYHIWIPKYGKKNLCSNPDLDPILRSAAVTSLTSPLLAMFGSCTTFVCRGRDTLIPYCIPPTALM